MSFNLGVELEHLGLFHMVLRRLCLRDATAAICALFGHFSYERCWQMWVPCLLRARAELGLSPFQDERVPRFCRAAKLSDFDLEHVRGYALEMLRGDHGTRHRDDGRTCTQGAQDDFFALHCDHGEPMEPWQAHMFFAALHPTLAWQHGEERLLLRRLTGATKSRTLEVDLRDPCLQWLTKRGILRLLSDHLLDPDRPHVHLVAQMPSKPPTKNKRELRYPPVPELIPIFAPGMPLLRPCPQIPPLAEPLVAAMPAIEYDADADADAPTARRLLAAARPLPKPDGGFELCLKIGTPDEKFAVQFLTANGFKYLLALLDIKPPAATPDRGFAMLVEQDAEPRPVALDFSDLLDEHKRLAAAGVPFSFFVHPACHGGRKLLSAIQSASSRPRSPVLQAILKPAAPKRKVSQAKASQAARAEGSLCELLSQAAAVARQNEAAQADLAAQLANVGDELAAARQELEKCKGDLKESQLEALGHMSRADECREKLKAQIEEARPLTDPRAVPDDPKLAAFLERQSIHTSSSVILALMRGIGEQGVELGELEKSFAVGLDFGSREWRVSMCFVRALLRPASKGALRRKNHLAVENDDGLDVEFNTEIGTRAPLRKRDLLADYYRMVEVGDVAVSWPAELTGWLRGDDGAAAPPKADLVAMATVLVLFVQS